MKTVVGVFSDVSEAQRTIDELVRSGFGLPEISVIANPRMRGGLQLDLVPLDVTDTGRVQARGPLARSLSEGASHDLSSSLRSLGLSSELASHYARAVQRGETLESVVVEDDRADAGNEALGTGAGRLARARAAHARQATQDASGALPHPSVGGQVTGAPHARPGLTYRGDHRTVYRR
jgi:hypothetical protein